MIGPRPGWYWVFWKICWMFLAPAVLLTVFTMMLIWGQTPRYATYRFPPWSLAVGWLLVTSSLMCIPVYAIYKFLITPGSVTERIRTIMIPEEVPDHTGCERVYV